MRNLTMKSNFTRPNTVNSFKKSDRQYDQPKKLQRKVSKGRMIDQDKGFTTIGSMPMRTQPILTHQLSMFRHHFNAQYPFPISERNSQDTYIQQTCLWFKKISKSPTNKKKFVKFVKIQYVLSNWSGDSFPTVIYICADGFVGYFDINGAVTDRVAALQLNQVSLTLDQAQLRTYELRYVLSSAIKWQIAPQLTHLKLSMKIEDQLDPIKLPLPNPITIQVQIGQQ